MSQQEIEKQIKSIPGNEPVLEKLYELLDSENAIAFVGAGASAGLWPMWDEFLKNFIEYTLVLGKINQPESEYFLKKYSQEPLKIAQQLKNKIGEPNYFDYLHNTFKDKLSQQTGGAFTLNHRLLLQLPIHNYVTLNYDAGLTNARADLYPKATTSYFFWDQEEIRKIRERGYERLVLHAHGRHDRANSIVLTLDDYRRAYDNSAFVRLLNDIFNYEQLLFVGFGMGDPYINYLFNNIKKDSSKTSFRHIALVGLNNMEMQVAHLHRDGIEMIYGASVLFYPIENQHKALQEWLIMLAEKYKTSPGSSTAKETIPLPSSPEIKAAIKDKYIHKPTDDENFKGRSQDFITLNRWANDPDTRTIAITGIGGQGKTALTGRWLKQERIENLKNVPVLYWSFYEDLDVQKFLEEVVNFCSPIVRIIGKPKTEPVSFILSVVQQARLLLVLDGIEVLQEDVSSPNHGRISHPLLFPFLQNWVRIPHKGLMILTSRFHFPQLQQYSGIGFHHLDLFRLSQEEGVALLKKLNVIGDQQILGNYVERLFGHPLALRVLASAVKRIYFGDLSQFNGEQLLSDEDDNRLNEKLKHLLNFYEKQLKGGQKELLGIISLFKRPVEIKSFVTLLSKMKSLENTPLAKADVYTVEEQIKVLIDDFLIEKTKDGITTHPIIRDYFRSGCKITGSRREVADFLKSRPGAERPKNIEEVHDLVEAVQLLCDEKEFKAAENLFTARLAQGGYGFNVFLSLPAIIEGLECVLAFVGAQDKIINVEKILGKSFVAFHCTGVSLYNYYLGNLENAIEWCHQSLEINKQLNFISAQTINLYAISSIELSMGNIKKAIETVSLALTCSFEIKDLNNFRSEFAYKAYYQFLLGNSKQAYKDFEFALLCTQKIKSNAKQLSSIWGNQQAEFFIRIHAWKQFKEVNARNIKVCTEYLWNDTYAFCYFLQGWYEIYNNQLIKAENELSKAEQILRPSGMLEHICRLDWVWALLAEAKEDYQKGLKHVNDALLVCADKGFRLWQADNFVLRGRLYLLQFNKENKQNRDLLEKAGDDGRRALEIAENTGYIWAKVDAIKLLSSYHQTRERIPDIDKEKEKEFAQRHSKEAAEIEKGLYLTEKEMEELKEQARKEFEEQTKDWDKK